MAALSYHHHLCRKIRRTFKTKGILEFRKGDPLLMGLHVVYNATWLLVTLRSFNFKSSSPMYKVENSCLNEILFFDSFM